MLKLPFRPRASCPHERKLGQSVVEFALVLPLLIILVVGILDLGRHYFAYITTINAAREGAAFGSKYPPVDEHNPLDPRMVAIVNRAKLEAQGSSIDPTKMAVEIMCPGPSCVAGFPIRVTVQYPFRLITAVVVGGGTIPLRARNEMEIVGE